MKELAVLLNDTVAGTLTELSGRRLSFTYERAYMEGDSPLPLSVSMPVQVAEHTDRVVAPWLWGLLPDNEAVLSRWARHYQVSPSSVFAMLSTPVGLDCPGAVRFVHRGQLEEVLADEGHVEWLSEAQVAQRLRELKEDSTAWLGKEFTGQFSLAGAQAKTALLFEDGRWGLPSGALATSHILKPAVAGLDDHDLNEHLCLEAGRRAGLICARTRIAKFEDQTAIVVDRYDRVLRNGTIARIHQEDLCQALAVHPSRKYQSEGGPGPDLIVGLLRSVIEPSAADDAVRRFVDALAWNWIIGGTDAHAKNYSLLLSGGQVRLAPLYDIASALPYRHEKKLRMAMKIGRDYALYNYRNPWPKAAADLELEQDRLLGRVLELATLAPDAFSDAAKQTEVAALGRPLPQKLIDLVAERAARCQQLLRGDQGLQRVPSAMTTEQSVADGESQSPEPIRLKKSPPTS